MLASDEIFDIIHTQQMTFETRGMTGMTTPSCPSSLLFGMRERHSTQQVDYLEPCRAQELVEPDNVRCDPARYLMEQPTTAAAARVCEGTSNERIMSPGRLCLTRFNSVGGVSGCAPNRRFRRMLCNLIAFGCNRLWSRSRHLSPNQ